MTTYGHYGVSTNLAGALRVSIGTSSCSSASTASQLDIATSNGAAAYPHLGLVAGAANTAPTNNLAAGSSNYAYLSGVAQTSPGAPAVAAGNTYTAASGRAAGTESAIWTYDAASGAVGAQWINGDGSVAPTYVVYSQADSSLLATGDVAKFRDAFGSANKPVVTFKLITAIAS
ncbi:hypothetical protein GLOTRDRAFT_138893 [Gloeophyllum trabeum ATCC 11539]|uniref:Uncharacterized protein n=1 Tax=Gloeophyllum trabeum (strain ATCC 11539 / FP-39264 / Madison 617) TaxID=670483 RepID=S7RLL7_GLOTA|nr:uncharacterized protein GLOTRDRAFT_138893 [Gloeophyllum trabeum ATCC 11539]EPQ55300.1 hypothetical protein GLOTRDRAFT_138893 [Gloeophyllum trabeum ATCC 11539]